MPNLNEIISDAINMLPSDNSEVVFDDYKAELYEAYPEHGQAAFERMIKADLIGMKLTNNGKGDVILVVHRLP